MGNEILIAALVFVMVVAIGGAIAAAIRASRQRAVQERLLDGAPTLPSESAKPGLDQFLSQVGKKVSSGKTSQGLREQLTKAGIHGQSAPSIYLGTKVVLLAAGVVGMLALLSTISWKVPLTFQVLLVAAGGAVLSFVPNMVLAFRRANRRNEIRAHLPDAIDLLEICVSSGMGVEMAWNLVGDEFRRVSPALADELALMNLEIHLGTPRAVAMRHLAIRTGAQEFGSLVAVLVQSERFGTSISDALQVFASSMRETRSAQVEEEAEKMAVKLLFPLVLFIFPSVIIVLAGPAALRLWSMIHSN